MKYLTHFSREHLVLPGILAIEVLRQPHYQVEKGWGGELSARFTDEGDLAVNTNDLNCCIYLLKDKSIEVSQHHDQFKKVIIYIGDRGIFNYRQMVSGKRSGKMFDYIDLSIRHDQILKFMTIEWSRRFTKDPMWWVKAFQERNERLISYQGHDTPKSFIVNGLKLLNEALQGASIEQLNAAGISLPVTTYLEQDQVEGLKSEGESAILEREKSEGNWIKLFIGSTDWKADLELCLQRPLSQMPRRVSQFIQAYLDCKIPAHIQNFQAQDLELRYNFKDELQRSIEVLRAYSELVWKTYPALREIESTMKSTGKSESEYSRFRQDFN